LVRRLTVSTRSVIEWPARVTTFALLWRAPRQIHRRVLPALIRTRNPQRHQGHDSSVASYPLMRCSCARLESWYVPPTTSIARQRCTARAVVAEHVPVRNGYVRHNGARGMVT